jgi:hypothetical protein
MFSVELDQRLMMIPDTMPTSGVPNLVGQAGRDVERDLAGIINNEFGGRDDKETAKILGDYACSWSGDRLRRAHFRSGAERGNDSV